ncbi:unnamed protein product [Paramecium primaurelia]|uniref:Uncharacterized protein n=1 Tax=Paramecium primaurelia TaxID=5886 RepID=A0A8S1M5P7_PARPR|nr:unnamed protein product [Paramecium primaurelia]
MNQVNLDKLLYPIMMSIRSLRTYFKQEDDNNRIILDCQNKVEAFVLSIMHFLLDLIVNGSDHTTISFNKNAQQLQRELRNKLDCIQDFVQSKDVANLKKNILKFYDFKEGFSESESEDDGVSLQIKLTGKMKEFNPEIQSLRIELDQKEQTIEALKQKLKYRQSSMEQMAHNHHKEVSVLKAHFVLNPQPEDPQSIFDIKYFDSTQMLDPEIVALMNEKINDIKNQYERYVKQFMDKFQKQRVQNNIEENIKQPSLEDFTSKDLLKIALDKENNPYIFFKNIQDLKSINYILNVLSNQQNQYGIDYDKINKAFKTKEEDLKKIVDTRIMMEDCQAQISAIYLVDLEKKQEEIQELNQMITQQDIEYKQQLKLIGDLIQNNNENSKQMILNQQQKIDHMRSENHNLSTMLLNQKQHSQQLKQQNQFLMNNLKHILNILLKKQSQSILGLDKYDLIKEKSAPIKDILNKLNNLEGYDLVTLIQEVRLILYQIESVKVVNQILGRGKLNKQTQTINYNQEFIEQKEEKKTKDKKEQKIVLKHLEEIKQETIKKNKLKIASTQTDIMNEFNSTQYHENIQDQKTIISQSEKCGTVSLNMLLKQLQCSIEQKPNSIRDLTPEPSIEKHNSIFDKLYIQQKQENPRWHQLRPLIEKLKEEEFNEVINTLGIYSSRQQYQQQQTQYTTMEIPLYDISRVQQSMIQKSSYKKRRDSSVDQTRNVFIELDEQRENALKLFEQQRIDNYRRRIKRLVPFQPSQCLQVEEKLRPKSQIRSTQQKPGY